MQILKYFDKPEIKSILENCQNKNVEGMVDSVVDLVGNTVFDDLKIKFALGTLGGLAGVAVSAGIVVVGNNYGYSVVKYAGYVTGAVSTVVSISSAGLLTSMYLLQKPVKSLCKRILKPITRTTVNQFLEEKVRETTN